MAHTEWPQPPEVDGRPLDTALVLNRDYYSQLYECISNFRYGLLIVPSNVVRDFAGITGIMVDALCSHGQVQLNCVGTIPKVRGRASTTNLAEWPQPPQIHGRPLDTALLLNRDYGLQVFARVQNGADYPNDKGVPAEVFGELLDNTVRLINALCTHGNILRNPLRSMPKVELPGYPLDKTSNGDFKKEVETPRDYYNDSAAAAEGKTKEVTAKPPRQNRLVAEIDS
ncbi:MAG: hypothetical protein Q9200_001587 [Gallowayella weberi]